MDEKSLRHGLFYPLTYDYKIAQTANQTKFVMDICLCLFIIRSGRTHLQRAQLVVQNKAKIFQSINRNHRPYIAIISDMGVGQKTEIGDKNTPICKFYLLEHFFKAENILMCEFQRECYSIKQIFIYGIYPVMEPLPTQISDDLCMYKCFEFNFNHYLHSLKSDIALSTCLQ